MITLHKYPYTNSLTEVMQVNDMRFAFVNPMEEVGHFQCIMPTVKCREYFNELLMINHHPNDYKFVPTHGFDYQYKEFPMVMDATRMAIFFKNDNQYQLFKKNITLIHKIESLNGFKLSEIHDVDGKTCIVIADKSWIANCLMTNIFTWILKLMTWDLTKHNTLQYTQVSELQFLNAITVSAVQKLFTHVRHFLKLSSKFVDGSNSDRGNYDVHGNSGIMAVNNGAAPKSLVNLYMEIMQMPAEEIFKVAK